MHFFLKKIIIIIIMKVVAYNSYVQYDNESVIGGR